VHPKLMMTMIMMKLGSCAVEDPLEYTKDNIRIFANNGHIIFIQMS
jgi:hypothetical protein